MAWKCTQKGPRKSKCYWIDTQAASQHVSTTYITNDEVTVVTTPSSGKRGVHPQVQISVTGANGGGGGGDIRQMRDMLLTDNSVESS